MTAYLYLKIVHYLNINVDSCAVIMNDLSTNVRYGRNMTISGLKVVLFNTI